MGGVVSSFTDDVLGFDPNGGGIFKVANDVLGEQIADNILGLDPSGGGIVPLVNTGANLAVSYALGDFAGGLLGGPSTILGTTTAASADAAFIAADAAQLAAQGLGEAQIASTLAASGTSLQAAQAAAALAAKNASAAEITKNLTTLSKDTSLMSPVQDTIPFETPTAQPTDIFKDTTIDTPIDYSLGGTNAPRIENMGTAQGIQVPAINEPVTVATTPIDYSLNIPSVPFEGLQMPTIPNLESMGGGQGLSISVPGGTVAEGGFVPTGTLPTLGNPASFINDPTVIDKAIATNTIPAGMTEDQFLKLIKGFTGLFGAAATNNLIQRPTVQTPTDFSVPTQGVPTYSPEYFQQVQQGYNQLLPNQPKDVVTPLQNWYNTPYSSSPDSVTAKLFGVI